VQVLAVGEHNSPSPWTSVPRDQFKLHELTGDICQDGSLPNPMRECSWPDDDSHAKEEPSELPSPVRDCPWPDDDIHAEEEPSELPSPVRDYPRPDDDIHVEEELSEQTPVSTHSQNNKNCLGWYYLTNVYQSIRTSYLISMLLF
jgi:hypothetical protein